MADVLVVASKVKKHIKDSGDCNTSSAFIDALSTKVANICNKAVEKAKADGRKTVMDRDIPTDM